jgi:hypothetical protein
MALRIDRRLAWQVVDGQAVIVDLVEGRMLGLNATGSLIWSLLAEQRDADLAQAVAQRFDVDLQSAARDVADFIGWLRERKLVAEA